jgi:hypothetical protein
MESSAVKSFAPVSARVPEPSLVRRPFIPVITPSMVSPPTLLTVIVASFARSRFALIVAAPAPLFTVMADPSTVAWLMVSLPPALICVTAESM